jgi:CheY-like chemotaxis protein
VVFSGTEQLSWQALIKLLQRYSIRLRDERSQAELFKLEQQATPEELAQLGTLLKKMEAIGLLNREETLKAIQLQLLTECDRYLFNVSGEAEFIPDSRLVLQAQLPGYNLEDLLARANQRQLEWRKLPAAIPSMQCHPILNREALRQSQMTAQKKQQIEKLVAIGKTLDEIAYKLAKEPLEIAKLFANLAQSGVVSMEIPPEADLPTAIPEIFLVDDSPLLVQQFQTLVKQWGYQVSFCTSPLNAVEEMLKSNPAAMFVDINMPDISGFELIKQIRRQPTLADIPLVLLTAEKSLSNQWRAQWANCKFLAKPRSREEISEFRTELRQLLRELAPLPTDTMV